MYLWRINCTLLSTKKQINEKTKTMNIKKHIQKTLILIALTFSQTVFFANNIQVSNVSLTGQNTTSKYTMVKFDISWENSWRTSSHESNWDAAWIFVKFRRKTGRVWSHASLNNDGHIAPDGTLITPGFPVVNQPFNPETNPAVGVFLYRKDNGQGDVNYTGVQLRWNYGINDLDERDSVEVSVFAIEMVYIPEGSFYVGDGVGSGSNSPGHFVAGNTTNPFKIESENELTIGNENDTQLWGTSTQLDADNTIGPPGTLPAEFPKGFQSFYIMKYELSQYMYKEFLNKLTQAQQTARIPISVEGRFMSNNNNPIYRNGIQLLSIPGGNRPRKYGNNLNNEGVENDSADGQHIACNFLSFEDLMAFADWSGLRPFTELEYEKACRGPLYPIADECAWRTTNMIWATGIDKSGMKDECATNIGANIVINRTTGGPMRCGCFANDTTNREQAGATYYGVMEMSGNLLEYAYSVGTEDNRCFNGNNHGDGKIENNGKTNVIGWPDGAGLRGGGWYDYNINSQQVSSRYRASKVYKTGRDGSIGFRLARTQQP